MSEAPSSSSEQSSSGVSSNNAAAIATLQAYVPKQMLHESDANYAERVAVFKQHVAELGIERAETLSTVWSNMRFLRSRYPPAVEERVKDWGGLEFLFERDKKKKELEELANLAAGRKPTK